MPDGDPVPTMNGHKRDCAWCGREFIARLGGKHQKYCGQDCRRSFWSYTNGRTQTHLRFCNQCRTYLPFGVGRGNRKFCSADCRYLFDRSKAGTDRCLRCGGIRGKSKKLCESCRQASLAKSIKNSHYRQKYGLTPNEVEDMLIRQGSRCLICEAYIGSSLDDSRLFNVDHNHACCGPERACRKCVRGLLCTACNQGLGWFRDDPNLMEKAQIYVRTRPVRAIAWVMQHDDEWPELDADGLYTGAIIRVKETA